jgi:hypothetical protein
MPRRDTPTATQLAAAIWPRARGGLAAEDDPRITQLVALRNLQPIADKREVYTLEIPAGNDEDGRGKTLELKHLRGTGWIARAGGDALYSVGPRPAESGNQTDELDPLDELHKQIQRLDKLSY